MTDLSIVTILPPVGAPDLEESASAVAALPGKTVEWIVVVRGGATDVAREPALASTTLRLRYEHVSPAAGMEDAIAAGWRRATGPLLVVHPWKLGMSWVEVLGLLDWLIRFDIVFAKRQRPRVLRSWHELFRLPRAIAGTREVHDADISCWAARAEALRDIPISAASVRRLPGLVTARGYRVGEVHQEDMRGAARWKAA